MTTFTTSRQVEEIKRAFSEYIDARDRYERANNGRKKHGVSEDAFIRRLAAIHHLPEDTVLEILTAS